MSNTLLLLSGGDTPMAIRSKIMARQVEAAASMG